MIPRIILVPYGGYDQDQPALGYALQLAQKHNAHIRGLYMTPEPENIIIPYGAYGAMAAYHESGIRDWERTNDERRKDAETRFLATVKDKSYERRSFLHLAGTPETIIAAQGRVADLVVMARTYENVDYMTLAESAIFGCARPVLLVPTDKGSYNIDTHTVLVAWNGSREAAQAVFSALPYLKSKKVLILSDQEDGAFAPSAYDLKNYLDCHDIGSEILTHMDQGSPLGSAILNTARMTKADMLVMGAWSHSRLREMVFGGVTDFMLHSADIPVFMAH